MKDLNLNIRTEDDPAAWMSADRDINHACERIYLKLDPEKRHARVTTRSHDFTATPVEEYNHRVYIYRLDDQVDATRFAGWLNGHADLIERICNGHSVEWDGSNNTGSLTEDAQDADKELSRLLNPSCDELPYSDRREYKRRGVPTHSLYFVSGGDHIAPARSEVIDEFGITADTSDERLEEIADEINAEAREAADAVLYGTLSELEHIREGLESERALV